MQDWVWFLLTVAVAVLGGILAIKLKIPLGGIIGALLFVAALNLLSDGRAVFYHPVKVAMQITIGAISGSRVGRDELKNMKKLLLPAGIIYLLYFVFAFLFGTLIYKTSSLDAITALLMACPGGASDIALIAEDFGANVAYTGILHVIRVIFCCVVLPPVFLAVIRRKEPAARKEQPKDAPVEHPPVQRESVGRILALLGVSAVGGVIFKLLSIPSGAIIGALLFSILYSCLFGKVTLPKWVRKFQLIATGAYVGATVTRPVVAGLGELALPILWLLLEIVVTTAVLSALVYRTRRLDLPTTLPSCSPGGMAEMILLADEIGGDVSTVAVVQAFRIVLVVTLFPSLLNLLLVFIV